MDPVSAIATAVGSIGSSLSPLFGNKAKDAAREDLIKKDWFQQLSASDQQFQISLEAANKRKSAEKKLIILSIVTLVLIFGITLVVLKLKAKK
jgi:hypothetical protein